VWSLLGSATPITLVPLGHVARLRVAELNHEAGRDAVHALAVVEAAVHEREDVLDGLGRFLRVGFDLERPLHRLKDDDRAGPRGLWRGRGLRRSGLSEDECRREDQDHHSNCNVPHLVLLIGPGSGPSMSAQAVTRFATTA